MAEAFKYQSLFVELFGRVTGRLMSSMCATQAEVDLLVLVPDPPPPALAERHVDLGSLLAGSQLSLAEADDDLPVNRFPNLRILRAVPDELAHALVVPPAAVVGVPPLRPFGTGDSNALTLEGPNALAHLAMIGPPLQTMVMAVPKAALTSTTYEPARTALATHGTVTHIVDLGRHAYHDLQPLPPLVLLRWQSERRDRRTRIVVLPEDRSLDLRAALEALDGATALGAESVFDVMLPSQGRWDLHKLHPGRQALLDQLHRQAGTVKLGDIADIRRGERTTADLVSATSSVQEALPTIRGRDIRADGIVPVGELELLVPVVPQSRQLFTVAVGDLIGQEIGERNRWAVVDAEHGGAVPGQTTVVVRPHSDCPVPSQYLAAYLNSRLAQRLLAPAALGTIPRVRPRDLVELPVPVPPLEADSIDKALIDIDEALVAANGIVAELAAARDALFDATSSAMSSREMATRFEEAANAARALRPVLLRQEDPAGRLRPVLPYPIARTLRTWAISEGPRERYEAMLEIAEAVAITLGMIGLAWSQETGALTEGRQNWQRALYGSGASLGHWIDVADQVATAARQASDPLGGYADALRPRRGNTGLLADLRALVTERNDARHGGAGPRSRAEASDRLRQRELNLDGIFKQLPFLAGMPFRLVERISRDRTTGAYTARTLRVVGDHPDFEPETIHTSDGLFDGVMYVELTPARMLSLEPFCNWLDCSMCLRSEVYYLDRIRDDRQARLKSFDRGHLYESEQIVDELRRAGFGAV